MNNTKLRHPSSELQANLRVSDYLSDFERPSCVESEIAVIPLTLTEITTRGLKEITGGSPFLLYTALLAGLNLYLFRRTGQPRLIIGSPFWQRKGMPPRLGILPINSVLDAQITFKAVLEQIRATLQKAYEGQSILAEAVIESPETGTVASNRRAFFDFAMSLDTLHGPLTDLGQDVNFEFSESSQGLHGCIRYRASLFRRKTIELIAIHYERLLAEALTYPRIPIEKLTIEKYHPTGPGSVSGQENLPVHELFRRRARLTPDRLAVICEDRTLTFGELDRCSDLLAFSLQSSGAGYGGTIGILMERSERVVIALLAVLKSRAAYVPLDPFGPEKRVRAMIEASGIKMLLIEKPLRQMVDTTGAVCVEVPEVKEHFDPTVKDLSVEPESPAYVIYTSGSTGLPKGVTVSHQALALRASALAQLFELTGHDRVLQFLSLAFDASAEEIYPTLISGSTLVIRPHARQLSPTEYWRECERLQVNVIHLPASYWGHVISELNVSSEMVPSCIRLMAVGGEPMDPTRTREYFAHARQNLRLLNMYGPTEATIAAAAFELHPNSFGKESRKRIPIGQSLLGTEVYILDHRLEHVPATWPGEISIAGEGLSAGYLAHPEATAERFCPHPDPIMPGERIYRTGDIGCYNSEGELEFLGRVDGQVKVRGSRIELGEIEAILKRVPGVREAVAVVVSSNTDKSIAACVTPHKGWRVRPEGLHLLPNGLEVHQVNTYETHAIFHEIFEDHRYFRGGLQLPSDGCVIDVGANIGLFTLFIAEHCPAARILAIEPAPAAFEKLQSNIELYRIQATPICAAVSAKEGMEKLTYYAGSSASSGLYADAARDAELASLTIQNSSGYALETAQELIEERFRPQQVECQLVSISSLIRTHAIQRIGLLKIDAERSEFDVLSGIAVDDWPKIQQIVLEVEDQDRRLRTILEILRERGFQTTVEQDPQLAGTTLNYVYARRVAAQSNVILDASATTCNLLRYTLGIRDLRSVLRAELPPVMVPTRVMSRDSLPLLPSGKPDRQAIVELLPVMEPTAHGECQTVEQVLQVIWQTLLQVPDVGLHDNFFDLGGNSLLIPRLRVAIKSRLGEEVSVIDLFHYTTISQLAQHIMKKAGVDSDEFSKISATMVGKKRLNRKLAILNDI